MNFIAHFHLSKNNTSYVVGNYLADLIQHKELSLLDSSTMEGIHFHRKIDSFTDQHPIVKDLKKLLSPHHGKYSGVVLDVLFDYCLYLNWDVFSSENFEKFRTRIYQILKDKQGLLPERLQLESKKMMAADWLLHYTHDKGLKKVFFGLAKRASYGGNLEKGLDTFYLHKGSVLHNFKPFYEDLIQYCEAYTHA
jgi:acyl carrier protein phosphodiesterase